MDWLTESVESLENGRRIELSKVEALRAIAEGIDSVATLLECIERQMDESCESAGAVAVSVSELTSTIDRALVTGIVIRE